MGRAISPASLTRKSEIRPEGEPNHVERQAYSPHRHHRNGRDRRELDRAVPGKGTGSRRDRCCAGRRDVAATLCESGLAGARAIGVSAWRVAVASHLHWRYAYRRGRRGLGPGKRTREDRLQEEALPPARRAVARRRDHCFELVGPHHERDSIGLPLAPRALCHRASVQSAPPDSPCRDRRWRKEILHQPREADRPAMQGGARARSQSPASGVGARSLLPRC